LGYEFEIIIGILKDGRIQNDRHKKSRAKEWYDLETIKQYTLG